MRSSFNVLYLADLNCIHDTKWISYFIKKRMGKAFLLTRPHQVFTDNSVEELTTLGSIPDFSHVRFYETLMGAYKIKRLIKKHKIDIIHILFAEPNALWCLFRKYFDVSMVITCRGTDVLFTIPETFKKKTFINYLVAPAYKFAFLRADWITATSECQLESVKKFSGRTNQLTIIRTGVELERLQSDTSHHFPLHDSLPFILFPRYIKPIYNHEFSLAAIALLSQEIKTSYKMVFVGKDSGDLAYQQKLEKLMLEQTDITFEFIEKQSQEALFELYKRASLVVMVPVSDGSPVSGMEALLCGAKVILGPLDYDPAVFSTAIHLKKWDTRELAETIIVALTNLQTKSLLTESIKLLMDRNYNMQKMMEIYKNGLQ